VFFYNCGYYHCGVHGHISILNENVFGVPMRCGDCSKNLRKIDRRNELPYLDEDVTDGQLSDYLAAELSGDYGSWNVGIIEYYCPSCHTTIQVQNDGIDNFKSLILGWHEKADDGDYFARFVFEYLSFIAHVKNNLYIYEPRDRSAIQLLKQENRLKDNYLKQVETDQELKSAWLRVIDELIRMPLRNSSRDPDYPEIDMWWNSFGASPNLEGEELRGRVLSLDDWHNMVEFWYAVRNNLFHGGKNPNIHRDLFLVEHAYITLSYLMSDEINRFR